ncbi:Muscle M-line assembly protein unc-89 [Wickerhamomyces ciferrii]|uniref:Muscle M-line assembly protein unc-89 n=1 Tax=Wickerhamomyces ciferrii (strain ATCC 14091 / BCRC 22168 / CBS 111 / JCM 3599 / NBRC 0793 / NRRL Y-1031 F-60-10) TaxID=1206466 RepID=K0KI52_WICCF|nr:Muscle M-line assembly protein unc-89 [Wickerhamomyces ciferrii]CCH42691.1 Muscle M-line assembly protein unc-89 [Wickerhamomyces ciferrii]
MLLLKKFTPRVDSRLQQRVYAFQDLESSESESEVEIEDDKDHHEPDVIEEKEEKLHVQGNRISNEQLRQYFTSKNSNEIIKNLPKESNSIKSQPQQQQQPQTNGKLEKQQLDLKKIEYRKKIDIVWNSIISKYSAYDEDDQGDLINLEDFSIEEDKGHIKQLQNFQRTTIWNDINDLENGNSNSKHEDFRKDFDPSQDPINLLNSNNSSRCSTPSQLDLLNNVNQNNKSIPQSRVKTPTTMKSNHINSLNSDVKDPITLLTPKPSTRPTRITSPRRRALLNKSFSKQRNKPEHVDLTNDPISMLTPTKPSRISTRISTRRTSPKRSSIINSNEIPNEPSSPMRFMTPSSPVFNQNHHQNGMNEVRYNENSDSEDDEQTLNETPDTNHDPISLLSKPKTRSYPSVYSRIDTSPLRSRVEPLTRQPSRGRTLKRSSYEGYTRQSSPLRQIEEDEETIEFKIPKITPSKRNNRVLNHSKQQPNTPLSSLRNHSNHKNLDFANDPICLLTPKSMTRRNSRIPTRSSSPNSLHKRQKIDQNDDPIVLLTPRSSSKRSRSIKPQINSKPPPKFNINSTPSTNLHPYYQPPPPPPPQQQQQQSNPFYQPHQPPYLPYNMPMNPYSMMSTPMTSRDQTPGPQHQSQRPRHTKPMKHQHQNHKKNPINSIPNTPLKSSFKSRPNTEAPTPNPLQYSYPNPYQFPQPNVPHQQMPQHMPQQMPPMMMNPYMNPYMFMPYMPMMPMYPPGSAPQGYHEQQSQHPLLKHSDDYDEDEEDDEDEDNGEDYEMISDIQFYRD